jgi:hypothetical protein
MLPFCLKHHLVPFFNFIQCRIHSFCCFHVHLFPGGIQWYVVFCHVSYSTHLKYSYHSSPLLDTISSIVLHHYSYFIISYTVLSLYFAVLNSPFPLNSNFCVPYTYSILHIHNIPSLNLIWNTHSPDWQLQQQYLI